VSSKKVLLKDMLNDYVEIINNMRKQ